MVKVAIKYYLTLLILAASLGAGAQQYLVLQKSGAVKNFKYQVGNDITIRVMRGDLIFSGTITQINDSSFVLNSLNEIYIGEIKNVYRRRVFVRVMSKVLLYAGIGYVGLEGINGIINNDSPVITKNTIIAGAVMVGTSFALKPFYTRSFDTREKYVIKILDFEEFE
jgi:hypothetical protein